MIDRNQIKELKELTIKNRWIMIIRLIIISMVLGIGSFVYGTVKIPFYTIISSYYLVSLIFIFLYRSAKTYLRLKTVSYLNLLFDILIITIVVHFTRGAGSPFAFFYIAVITTSGIILSAKIALINSIICSVFFIGLVAFEALNIIPPIPEAIYLYKDIWTIVYLTNIKIAIFVLISLLTGNTLKKLKKSEEEILDLQFFYGNILKSIANGIIAFDMKGIITYANKPITSFLNKKPMDIMGKKADDVFSNNPDLLKLIIHSIAHEKLIIRNEETNLMDSKNKILPIAFTLSPLKNKSRKIIGKVLVLINLTEIKAMEETMRRKEKLSAIGELSANIAHEIRNPLASISGSIEVLNENLNLEGKLQELIKTILKESSRLNKIISNFLTYAKDQQLQLDSINLGESICELIEIIKNNENIKNKIKLTLNNNLKQDCYINGEEDLLKQVFHNLVTNAIDALNDKGNLIIELECIHKNNKPFAKIIFKDDGPGINEADKEKIFQPFFTTKKNGSGIGLAIVSKIIKKHNGDIIVQSNKGKGTAFIIYLPCVN